MILCAVDFQAIYSEGAQPYFSMLWERLLDSVEDANQPLAVLGAPYVSGSLEELQVICFGDFNGARPMLAAATARQHDSGR